MYQLCCNKMPQSTGFLFPEMYHETSFLPPAILYIKRQILYLVFYPRTRPRTSLQCFASEQRESKAKHCRDVLGRVLG